MAATHTPNLNLNKPDPQDYVSVVTDINDNMDMIDGAMGAIPTGLSLQGQINTLKPITITIDPVTNASGAYTHTTNDSRVTEGLKATGIEVGTPETFKAPIRITTGNGTIELYCANAVGSSTVVVTLEESTPLDSADPQPASVTSTEFDILANRIGTLSNLHTTNKTSLVDATNEVSDQIATIGTVLTGSWTATETSAVLVQLTQSITLTKGTWLVMATVPVVDSGNPTVVIGPQIPLIDNYEFGAASKAGEQAIRIIKVDTSQPVYAITGGSSPVTYNSNFLTRGGIRAVKIGA